MNAGALTLRIGLGVVVALVAFAGIVYATDYGVEGNVVGKDCGAGGGVFPLAAPSVTVKTKLGGLRHTQGLPAHECAVTPIGGFVVYHLRSGRTSLYETEGGDCIYDSRDGIGGCP